MYLMTAHRTLVGTDQRDHLVQVPCRMENVSKFARCEITQSGVLVGRGPLEAFQVEQTGHGVSFSRNGKYLCALSDQATLVPDREKRQEWESYALIPEDKIAKFLLSGNKSDAERFADMVATLHLEGRPVKLYCGAGQVPRPGFLNLDIALNAPGFFASNVDEYFVFPFAEMPWKLPDNSVDYIFHEDFIEHLSQLMQFQFLAETLRVLKPGCWHRVNTPNILASMKRHSNFREGFRGVYTGEQQWGHISIFSPLSLKEVAELVGYREVIFTTRHHGVSPFAEKDFRPAGDRDEVVGNIYADLLK
jgi:hypothetical protein